MAQDNEEKIQELAAKIKKLPPYPQAVICWLIKNYDAIQEMSRNSEMTLPEIEREMEIALQERQYALFALLFLSSKEIEKRERGKNETDPL